jgi:hypothetical protein
LDIAARAEGDSGAEANRSRAEREAKVARNAGDARSSRGSLWNFVFREVTKRELARRQAEIARRFGIAERARREMMT